MIFACLAQSNNVGLLSYHNLFLRNTQTLYNHNCALTYTASIANEGADTSSLPPLRLCYTSETNIIQCKNLTFFKITLLLFIFKKKKKKNTP